VIGRSLGTGIAAYVASQRPVAAAILITPYDSIVEIARRRFPYCAAQFLLKHRFDALRFASLATAPALVLLAEHDTVIPKHHAMRLVEAWGGQKQVTTIAETDHCDVQAHQVSWKAIAAFLKQQFGNPMRDGMTAVSREQLQVRSGGTALIDYAAWVVRSTLEADLDRPSAALSTHSSR